MDILLKKNIYAFLLLLVGIFFVWSCKPKKDPEPDPCAGKVPFKADFKMTPGFFGDSLMPTDEFYRESIKFIALDNYETYQWKIGDDPRTFTTKQVALNFQNASGGDYLVQLIATRKASGCFPNEKIKDTVRKTFKIHVFPTATGTTQDSSLITYVGRWRGSYTDAPNQMLTIPIALYGNYPNGEENGIRIFNIPQGCNENIFPYFPAYFPTRPRVMYLYGSYKIFRFASGSDDPSVVCNTNNDDGYKIKRGFGEVDNSVVPNKITISYGIKNNLTETVYKTRTFIGYRQ